MARIIFYIIVIYFIAKILGVVVQFLRKIFFPTRPNIQTIKKKQTQRFENIQDVDYEEIIDQK